MYELIALVCIAFIGGKADTVVCGDPLEYTNAHSVPSDCEVLLGGLTGCDPAIGACGTGSTLVLENLRVIQGDLHVALTQLESVTFTKLTSVQGFMRIEFNDVLNTMNFPALRSIGAYFDLLNNTALVGFSAPLLESSALSFTIKDHTMLESLLLTNLQTVGGSLTVQSCSALTTLMLPSMEALGKELTVQNNDKLHTIALPVLPSLFETVTITDNVPGGSFVRLYSLRFLASRITHNFTGVAVGGLQSCASALSTAVAIHESVTTCGGFDQPRVPLSEATGWPSTVPPELIADVCEANRQARDNNAGKPQVCTAATPCDWKSLGCYLQLSRGQQLIMDCRDVGLVGVLELSAIDWEIDRPAWAVGTVVSLDLSGNNISKAGGSSILCRDAGLPYLEHLTLENNPLSHIHEKLLESVETCHNLTVWKDDSRTCPFGTKPEPRAFGVKDTIVFVCECMEGSYCGDDFTVLRCGSNTYLDTDKCVACPQGSTSEPGSYNIDGCIEVPSATLDIVGITLSGLLIVLVLLWVVLIFCCLRSKEAYKDKVIAWFAPVPVLFAVYDLLTDVLFTVELAGSRDSQYFMVVAVLALVVPVTLNSITLSYIWHQGCITPNHAGKLTFKEFSDKHVLALIPLWIVCAVNMQCLNLLGSNLFLWDIFNMKPPKTEALQTTSPLISNLFEDLPQFLLQLTWGLLSNGFSTVSKLSLGATGCSLFMQLLGKFFFVVALKTTDSDGNTGGMGNDENRAESALSSYCNRKLGPQSVRKLFALVEDYKAKPGKLKEMGEFLKTKSDSQ